MSFGPRAIVRSSRLAALVVSPFKTSGSVLSAPARSSIYADASRASPRILLNTGGAVPFKNQAIFASPQIRRAVYADEPVISRAIYAAGISDTFDRADNTGPIGTASDGGTWTVISGTVGITSNQAYIVPATGTGEMNRNLGHTDTTISALVTMNNGKFPAITLRGDAGGANKVMVFFTTGNVEIGEVVASAYTAKASGASGISPGVQASVSVIAAGGLITAKVGAATIATWTTSLLTGAYVGLTFSDDTDRWDNFAAT